MARVLLVDHNESVLKNVRSALIQEGLDICAEAATGKQAIEQATLLKPDFVVLDYSLPDLTGVQVAYEIRQRLGNVKIVFFTFHDEAVISAAARVVGADAFVPKSSLGELVLAVRRLIEDRGPVGLGGASIGPTVSPDVPNPKIQDPFAAKRASAIPRRKINTL
jgi:two-component system response regulator NreC